MFIIEDEKTLLLTIEAKNNGIILELRHCIINYSDVMKRLANLSTDKACVVDMVHHLVLKSFAESVAIQNINLFRIVRKRGTTNTMESS